ncbi:MAG TPA: hypothetical protein VKR57_10050 [Terriglobales bacterium]|nr:hypothetical protein [Terriglobales bacterium]
MSLNMTDPKLIVLPAVVVLIIVVAASLYLRKRRRTTADLRQKFGPEYERALMTQGSERKAEAKMFKTDQSRQPQRFTICKSIAPTRRRAVMG